MDISKRSTSLQIGFETNYLGYSPREIAIRLFLTCWLVYTLHFATNTVREIYPALALGDHLTFRVDEYANMHPDLFEKEGYGWHIGNNPGVSMVAAIPYALARPLIDPVVAYVNNSRVEAGLSEPPSYDSPWPMAQEFYAEAWRRGYDIKFGLGAFVMQAFAMAPASALGVVAMFYLLRQVFKSDRSATWLSLLFAFGTPVFFRTGYLNQNLMLGMITFAGFILMWNLAGSERWSVQTRYFIGGLAGGTAVLFDYSGIVLLLGLFIYGFVKQWRSASFSSALRVSLWYILGSIGPILMLWLYQWRSFGNPFLPGQHWMPPVEWIDRGYQGYGPPQLELLLVLGFDHRFGFFMASPLMLLALITPFIDRGSSRKLPQLETIFMLSLFLAFWLFFSGSNYTRLQFNTGVRYMTPMYPFMFVLAAVTLMRLPRVFIWFIAIFSVFESWSLAMYRDVEKPLGLLDPMLRTLFGGFQLPVLSTISRLEYLFGQWFPNGVSPLTLMVLAAAVIIVIWSPQIWGKKRG